MQPNQNYKNGFVSIIQKNALFEKYFAFWKKGHFLKCPFFKMDLTFFSGFYIIFSQPNLYNSGIMNYYMRP